MSRDVSPFGNELEDFAPVAGWRDSTVNMTTSDIPGDPIAASTVMRPTGGQRNNSDVRGSFMETASWQAGNGLGNDSSSNVDDFIRSHRLLGMLQDIDMSGLSIGSDAHPAHPGNITGSTDQTLDGTTSSLGIIHLDSVHADLSGSLVHVEDPVREEQLDRTLTPDPSGHPDSPPTLRGRGAGEDVHIPSHPQSAFWPVHDTDDRRISCGSELGSNTTDMSIFSHRDSSILPLDNFDLLEEELDRMNQTQDEDEPDHHFMGQNVDRNRAPDSPPHISATAEPTVLRRLSSGDGEERLSAGSPGPATGRDSAEESEIDTEDELEAVRREMASRGEYLTKGLDRVGVGASGESSGNGKPSSRPELLGQNSEGVSPLDSMRQSAEGDVVTSPVPGDGGGGGDGSSGNSSDDNRPVQIAGGQLTLDVLRGLGVMPAPQARRPSQGSTRDDTDTSDPVERMGPVGSGGGDPPDVRGVHFASMDEYRQISRTSSLSPQSLSQHDNRDGWEQENQPGNGQQLNNETGDQTSLLASKFFLPTSRPSSDSVVSESTTASRLGRDRTSADLGENDDTLVGIEKDFGDGEEQEEDLAGHQDVENPFDNEEDLNWRSAGDFGQENGALQGLDNPFGAVRSSLGSFGLEQRDEEEHDGKGALVGDVTFSQKVSFGEGEFSQLMPGSPRSSAGDRSNNSRTEQTNTSQQAEGTPFDHVIVSKCKQLPGEVGEPSPVYIDENGQGVTDLAFHPDNPFDDMAQEEDAKDMLAEDEAKFEKDNVFVQGDAMATPAGSVGPGEWSVPTGSQFQCLDALLRRHHGHPSRFSGPRELVGAHWVTVPVFRCFGELTTVEMPWPPRPDLSARGVVGAHGGDAMATPAGSVGPGEWSVPTGSQFVVVQDSFSGEEPFLRISIGTFIGQRTEALGSLGDDGGIERPHFGRTIVTPPSNRMPVALIRLSEVNDSLYLHDETLTPGYHPEDETPYPERARAQPRIKLVNDDTIVIETTQEAIGQSQDASTDALRGSRATDKTTPVSHLSKTKVAADKKGQKADQVGPAAEQRRTQQARKGVSNSEQKIQSAKPAYDKATKDEKLRPKPDPDSLMHDSVAGQSKDLRAEDVSISDKTMDASCAGPNISSIASAIVNASVSDDPTKLADMILKLSEKTSKGRDRKKGPKQASSGKPVGLGHNKVPGSQVAKEQENADFERRPLKGPVYKSGSADVKPPVKHLPVSNANKGNEKREKETAKELPVKKQSGLGGPSNDKRNESGIASSDASKLGSPTKLKSRIPVKQRDASKIKSPTKVSFLDRSENADDGTGSRVQKLDRPVDDSFGTAGKKGSRSYKLEGDQEFEGFGQPSKDTSAQKSSTDASAFSDPVRGIPGDGKHSRTAVIPGKDGLTKEFSQARDSRLKVDHSSRPKTQEDSVDSGTVKDKWETMEPILRTREHSPSRKTGTQYPPKDKPSKSGQENMLNNLSFSINSNYDVDIKYNFDVGKEDVTVEGWPSRSKDKTSGPRTLFRERSPIRDRSPIKSPRRRTSPGFDTSKEYGHGKRDGHHGKGKRSHSPKSVFRNTYPDARPDHGSNLHHDHRKSSTEVPKKHDMPSEVKDRQSRSSSSRARTNGVDFDMAAPIRKPKRR
ncbi:hypothetical protein Bbelb_311710 [Branchiostoma belcheri]|nr:hypothetical protein Bbelb_311710 [Branchiostoma belcheri]